MTQHCRLFTRMMCQACSGCPDLLVFVAFIKGFSELLIKAAEYKTTPLKDFFGLVPAQLADYFQLMKSYSQYQIIVSTSHKSNQIRFLVAMATQEKSPTKPVALQSDYHSFILNYCLKCFIKIKSASPEIHSQAGLITTCIIKAFPI